MKKYLKVFTFFLFITLIASFSIMNFLHYKMEKELYVYLQLNEKITHLSDTYSLCVGLLKTNPSKENLKSCNIVFNKIKEKTEQVKEECPYIYFYTNYVNNI